MKNLKIIAIALTLSSFASLAQDVEQLTATGITQAAPASSWWNPSSWIYGGAQKVGSFFHSLIPQQIKDLVATANRTVSDARQTARDQWNFISDIFGRGQALTGQALQATQEQLATLNKQTLEILNGALAVNERAAAKLGVPEEYQRAAAIVGLGVEAAAAVATTVYSIMQARELLNYALSAAKSGTLTGTLARATITHVGEKLAQGTTELVDIATKEAVTRTGSKTTTSMSPEQALQALQALNPQEVEALLAVLKSS